MDEKIAVGVAVVKVATDVLKALIPSLQGRVTQLVVLGISILWAIVFIGVSDIPVLIAAVGAIFAGSIAADQVLKKVV